MYSLSVAMIQYINIFIQLVCKKSKLLKELIVNKVDRKKWRQGNHSPHHINP